MWAPTAVGSAVLAAEIPAATALVSRAPDGADALAAIGAAMSVLVIANSVALAMAPLVVTAEGTRTPRALLRYSLLVGLCGGALLVAVAAIPPLAAPLPPEFRDDFRYCLLAAAPAPPAVALRRYLHGRLILAGGTGRIASATFIRVGVTVLTAAACLALTPLPAAAVGGLSPAVGAFAEAGLLALAVRRLPRSPGQEAAEGGRGRRSLPAEHARLAAPFLVNMAPHLVTTIAITAAPEPAASLTVWTALYGLLLLLTVPMLDLDSVTAARLRKDPADPGPLRLAWAVASAAGGLLLLGTVTPLAGLYVTDVIAVPPGPAELGLRWLPVLVAAPPLWAVRGYLRGRAMAAGRSDLLPQSVAAHVVVLAGACAALPATGLPGVACASIALVAALAAETAALLARLRAAARVAAPEPGGSRTGAR
ncbi:hypothetical protein [Bailinhaonella thermotolerans]|uniref:Membrane protein involved in the export of O-antigen and teichoic acid n=1 Tax=Bailinhaonella thermotolerans TaxID=1070861 RepID=A0A3A4AUX2_9ACTN|nr:hypothetical protein [Bailinhaonella thermotolerans]RJL33395.1 hypothetical protein D5H75_11430 [Bailinhaonella thermotolerans]